LATLAPWRLNPDLPQVGARQTWGSEENRRMKPKQLANVLTRILGLSLCAQGIPGLLGTIATGFYLLVQRMHDGIPNSVDHYNNAIYTLLYWVTRLTPVVEFAVGIGLIVRSRFIVEKLFQDEAE
jgi:hypothetical protein